MCASTWVRWTAARLHPLSTTFPCRSCSWSIPAHLAVRPIRGSTSISTACSTIAEWAIWWLPLTTTRGPSPCLPHSMPPTMGSRYIGVAAPTSTPPPPALPLAPASNGTTSVSSWRATAPLPACLPIPSCKASPHTGPPSAGLLVWERQRGISPIVPWTTPYGQSTPSAGTTPHTPSQASMPTPNMSSAWLPLAAHRWHPLYGDIPTATHRAYPSASTSKPGHPTAPSPIVGTEVPALPRSLPPAPPTAATTYFTCIPPAPTTAT